MDTAVRLVDSLKEFLLRSRAEGYQKLISGIDFFVETVVQKLSGRFCNLQLVSDKFKFITEMEHRNSRIIQKLFEKFLNGHSN